MEKFPGKIETPGGPGDNPITSGPIAPGATAAPPHPLDREWHLFVEGQTYGPYSGRVIAEFANEGRINANTQVFRVGGEQWSRASADPALAALFKKPSPPLPPPAKIEAAQGATVVNVTNTIASPPLQFVAGMDPIGPKSPGVALLLSFIICGAGQMYCGKVAKGVLMLIACILLWLVFLGWIIWIWSMIDAYVTAKNMNLRYLQATNSSS